jgi:hypothetical protein
MHRRILLLYFLILSAGSVTAQRSLSIALNTISTSNTDIGKFYFGNRNEPPRAIEFKEGTLTPSHFVANINTYLTIPAECNFIELESNSDHLGMHHRLLQQYYRGIPIEGMNYRVHERNGFVTSANGRAVRNINVDPQTMLSEDQAFRVAVKYLHTRDTVSRAGKKLIVSKNFTFAPESFSIAFQFDIDVSLIERWRISIDARTGEVINKVSLVHTCFNENMPPLPPETGMGITYYYGSQTILVEKFASGSSRMVGQTENGGTIGPTISIMRAFLHCFLVLTFRSTISIPQITSTTTRIKKQRFQSNGGQKRLTNTTLKNIAGKALTTITLPSHRMCT